MPKKVFFEPTGLCNLKCKMCYLTPEFLSDSSQMTLEDTKTVIKNMEGDINTLTFIGGEPLTTRGMFDILDLLEGKNIRVNFATNLTLLNEEKIARLAKYSFINRIGTSIDGPKTAHNMVRGLPYAFDRTTYTVKQIKGRYQTTATSVVLKENLDQLKDLVKINQVIGTDAMFFELERKVTQEDVDKSIESLGVSPKAFEFLTVCDSNLPDFTEEELNKAIKDSKKEAKKLGVNLVFFPPNFKKAMKNYYSRESQNYKKSICQDMESIRVDPMGNVYHCFAIREPFGNLRKQSLEEIWESPKYKAFRKRMLNGKPPAICQTCHYLKKIR